MSTQSYRYRVVDVFTESPLEGNPLAVFPDAQGLGEHTMQRIAKELNLSETVFILPSGREGCIARVRIFTPAAEMRFAGHPTVGASYVLLDEGVVSADTGQFSLDEQIGVVPVRIDKGERSLIWLTTPPIVFGARYPREACIEALGLLPEDLPDVPPQLVTAGNPNIFIALKDKAAVDRAWIERAGVRRICGPDHDPVCIFVFTPTPEGAYSRMFAPEFGVTEDPATGSATGPLAAYMMANRLVADADGGRFVSEQGTRMGRRSLLHILINGKGGSGSIEVGGHVAPLAEATMTLPSDL